MLTSSEIRALNIWCALRELSWSAAHPAGDCAVMMLRQRDARRPWQRMRVILGSEIRLENELGETLASASDLPALLDAVDGGVADGPAVPDTVLAGLLDAPFTMAAARAA